MKEDNFTYLALAVGLIASSITVYQYLKERGLI